MNEIKRDLYLNKLINKIDNGLIKVITGIKFSGKSYLLFNIFYNYLLKLGISKENIITLSLDNDQNKELRDCDKLSNYLYTNIENKKGKCYILIDEIQFAISHSEIKKNESLRIYGILNGLLEHGNVDIYVTGSNSKFLSSDILTEFRGRSDELRVYPLSFSEVWETNLYLDKYEAWNEYTMYGGLPLIYSKKMMKKKFHIY